MAKCPACDDKRSVTIHDTIAGVVVEYDAPCPVCTDILEILQSIKDESGVRTKSTMIPRKGIDDEDD